MSKNLPPQIVASLGKVIKRVRSIQTIKGGLATVAALIFSIVGVMILDWAFNVERSSVRWTLSLSALAITLFTAWRYVYKPLSKKITLTSVARWIETHHPEMHERISTSVEMAAHGEGASQSLINEVVKEAITDVAQLDPKSELTNKAVRTPIWTAATALGILLALFAAFPRIARNLFARAVAPFAQLGNANAGDVRFITEDNQIVTAGDSFIIEAAYTAGKEKRAVLIMKYPDGTTVRETMTEDSALSGLKPEERGISFRLPTHTTSQAEAVAP